MNYMRLSLILNSISAAKFPFFNIKLKSQTFKPIYICDTQRLVQK
jgi:hypothetical protein